MPLCKKWLFLQVYSVLFVGLVLHSVDNTMRFFMFSCCFVRLNGRGWDDDDGC